MTREERKIAVKEFKEWRDSYYNKNKLPATMFIEEAIKALERQPCEDAISRTDVIELISDIKDTVFGQTVIKGVETLPSVQPKMTVEQAQNIIVDDFSRTVQTVNKILDREVSE